MVGAADTACWYLDLEAVRVEVGQHQVVGQDGVDVQAASGVHVVVDGGQDAAIRRKQAGPQVRGLAGVGLPGPFGEEGEAAPPTRRPSHQRPIR